MNGVFILSLLLIKHFICDFLLQTKCQYENKGNYGSFGGLLHASLHAFGTLLVFCFFVPFELSLLFAFIDGLVHYHVDWTKVYLNKHFNLNPFSGQRYWVLLGFDQFLHQMTYVALVYLAIPGLTP